MKVLTDSVASIDEVGWQTEYRKSKCIGNESNKPLKIVNGFFPLCTSQEDTEY